MSGPPRPPRPIVAWSGEPHNAGPSPRRGDETMKPPGWPVALLALFVLAPFAPPLAAQTSKPNLVVFLPDDHGYLDSEPDGAADVRTPNLKKLAAAGCTFTGMFVASPSCAPSRAALLTGLMPARNGAEANHAKPRPAVKKLPAYLQALGYEVAAFGK